MSTKRLINCTYLLGATLLFVLILNLHPFNILSASAAKAGDLIKAKGSSAVYYLDASNKRHLFNNQNVYASWYKDFSSVVTISTTEMNSYALGSNVTLRPGTKLLKSSNSKTVYTVEANGALRALSSEAEARNIFGPNWHKKVMTVNSTFLADYKTGSPLANEAYPAGIIINDSGTSNFYYYNGSHFRRIISAEAFNANRLRSENIIVSPLDPTDSMLGQDVIGYEADISDLSKSGLSTIINKVSSNCSGSATRACTFANGKGTQTRTCTGRTWSSWSTCAYVSCNSGYTYNGTKCVKNCTGATSQTCAITNGTGQQTRTCTSGAWSSWSTCIITTCNTGYQDNGAGSCVLTKSIDKTAPVISAFSIAPSSLSLTADITNLTATDNIGVVGYKLTETNTKPSAYSFNWTKTPRTSYTFTSPGTKTLYAWAKDAAGNVSSSLSATITVSNNVPAITINSPLNNSTVTSHSVPLNFTVTGSPTSCWYDLGGSTTFTLPNCQNTTLTLANNDYALNLYAKNAAEEWDLDSTWFKVAVPSDATPPTISSFSLPSSSNSLSVQITALVATDNIIVTGYKLTENNSKPLASASGWTSSVPTLYTFATVGTKTLYAWAKDAAGNVSSGASATVTVSAPAATGNIYYISPSGSDTAGNGTITNPWFTLSKAWSAVRSGDTIYLRGGTYTYTSQQVLNGKSGSSSSSIKVWNYPGETPIITLNVTGAPTSDTALIKLTGSYIEFKGIEVNGLKTLSGWVNDGGNIWKTALISESPINMVVIDGNNTAMGRYPNANAANSGYLHIDSHVGITSITDAALPTSPNFTGGELVLRDYSWGMIRTIITNHTGQKLTYQAYTGADGVTQPSDNYSGGLGTAYFVQNDRDTLDQFGEWYYDGANFYIYSSGEPSSHAVKVAVVNNLLYITNSSRITLDGVTLQGSGLSSFKTSGSDYVTLQNSVINYSGKYGVESSGGTAQSFKTLNSTISNSNAGGIVLQSANYNALISGNTVTNTGLFQGMGSKTNRDDFSVGIWMYHVHGAVIQYNRVINSGYNGITFDGFDIDVANNYIDTFCSIADDGAGIYTWDDDNHIPQPIANTRYVRNNIIKNGVGAYQGGQANGIYMDDGTDNVEISGNTVLNNSGDGIFIHHNTRINVHNNTLYNNGTMNSSNSAYGVNLSNTATDEPMLNIKVENNIIASTINQKAILFVSLTDIPTELSVMGTVDNNYYAFPLNNDPKFYVTNWEVYDPHVYLSQNFAQWKAYTGKDANSKLLSGTVSGVSYVLFDYNDSSSNKIVSLGASTYKDVYGVAHTGSITLAPYTSIILMKQ